MNRIDDGISGKFEPAEVETMVRTLAEIAGSGDWRSIDPHDELSQRQKDLAEEAWELLRIERDPE